MKQLITTFKSFAIVGLMISGALFVNSCTEEEPEPAPDPIAAFQFEVSQTNFLEVSFTNFSQNAATYSWAFGDGTSSTDENPTHTYAEAGTYTVTLTATNADGVSKEKSESIAITDPDAELTRLAGQSSRTWYLQREGIALGIGPTPGDNQWWSFGGVTPLGERPCILDDTFTFHRDGTFVQNTGGTIFIDSFGNGGWYESEGCHDETETGVFTGPNAEDLSDFANGGSYTFDLNNNDQTLTLNGSGAYIGLPNKTAGGDNYIPIATKMYSIINFVDGDIADSLAISLVGDGFAWNFYLVAYDNINDLPDLPAAQPAASFSFVANDLEVTFTNTSKNSTTYSWNFGDGSTSTEVNPVHTYANGGVYDVTLTASDDNANSSETTQAVTVSAAPLTKADLASATGKTWTLAPVPGSIRVGPSIGSGEWYAINEADVTARACMYDDEFTFFDDDRFHFAALGQLWGEPFMGVDNACVNEGDLTGAYVGLASSTAYTFSFTDATESENAKITVTGDGAFIGFSKGYNGGEYNGSDAQLQSSITYEVISYLNDGTTEIYEIAVDISGNQDRTAWWTMKMQVK